MKTILKHPTLYLLFFLAALVTTASLSTHAYAIVTCNGGCGNETGPSPSPSPAASGSGSGASQCYDTDVQINYVCGPGQNVNVYTTVQVQGGGSTKGTCTDASQIAQATCCPNGSTCYTFASGTCYSLVSQSENTGTGTEEWQPQPTCTANIFTNPQDVPMANDLGPDQATNACQSQNTANNCDVVSLLDEVIQFLSVAVGVVIVIVAVIGGIQYSTSRDNPQAAAAAKGRLMNAVIAAIMFLLLYSFLQWIVPGGFFNSSTPSSSASSLSSG